MTPSPPLICDGFQATRHFPRLGPSLLCWSHCDRERSVKRQVRCQTKSFQWWVMGSPVQHQGALSLSLQDLLPTHLAHEWWSQEELICGETDLGAA